MNTPSTNKCCRFCKDPVYNTLTHTVMFYKCKSLSCHCHKPTEPSEEKKLVDRQMNRIIDNMALTTRGPLHEPSEVRIKPGEGKIIDGDSFTLTQDGDDLIATPQQKEASWEERLKCVGCCQGDYCAGKAGEHDEELKSFLRTEIAQAEKRGEVKALESLMEDERTGGIALVMIKDRLTALRNTNE